MKSAKPLKLNRNRPKWGGLRKWLVANHLTDPEPRLLDADFDGLADILAEDLIAEPAGCGRRVTAPEVY